MYDILKLTIQSGNFKFSEIQHRIKKLYATGDLTEAQLDELLSMAAENSSPDMERPETLALIQNLAAKVTALEQTVKELISGKGNDEDGDSDQYPAWEPWDGLSQDYQTGAIVEHNGQLWQSTYSGQNVWEPGTVDDRFWVKYSPEA